MKYYFITVAILLGALMFYTLGYSFFGETYVMRIKLSSLEKGIEIYLVN